MKCKQQCSCRCSPSSSCSCSAGTRTATSSRILEHWIAPAEDWRPAPESERRFRVTRFHKGEDAGFREATVSMRSLKSQIENFAKGDDLYCILVTPV